jgi:hypothetical protein
MKKKFPDSVLVIIQKSKKSNLNQIEKKKFIIARYSTIIDVYAILRKKIQIHKDEAFFLFAIN